MKRYILAAIAFLIILLCIIIIYLNLGKPYLSDKNPMVGSPINNTIVLTDQEKSLAIDVALNNSYFHEAMGNLLGGIEEMGNRSGGIYDTNVSYYVEGVIVSSYRDTSPWGNNTTYTSPVVVIVIGNSSMAGANMYVFVDLNKSRVPYIGYVPRAGAISDSIQYSSDGGGVQINISSGTQWPSSSYLDNMTIVDTGVEKYSNRTELNAKAIEIALNDSTLTNYLNGYMYHIDDVMMHYNDTYNSDYQGRYAVSYTVVVIEAYKNLTSTIYYYTVAVNLLNGHTIVNNLGTMTPWPSNILNTADPVQKFLMIYC